MPNQYVFIHTDFQARKVNWLTYYYEGWSVLSSLRPHSNLVGRGDRYTDMYFPGFAKGSAFNTNKSVCNQIIKIPYL